MRLVIKDLVCGFGSRIVVDKFNLTINSGEMLCLLGPNGVGKTTLFKTILGFLKPMGGNITLNDKNTNSMSRRQFAKIMGYVPQAHTPPFPFKVIDVVMMGRTAHIGIFQTPGRHDREVAINMLERLGVGFLINRTYTEISGGERQLVLIARALAQQPAFLLLDEPTSNLDFGNQVRVLQCISGLARENGLGVIMTTHYPDHAFQCNGDVALMERDNVFLTGRAEKIITAENMKNTYGIDIRVVKNHIDNFEVSSCIPVISKQAN
ncbi:MAG: ABC transporter ATP-binding protein [Desulfobacteraceae bacterium]|jgi:iron complex transport system ATP-binding protein